MAPLDDALLAQLPDTLTYDDGGVAKPLRGHDFIKNAPDFATFAKTALDAHREVGARVPLRINTPEDRERWKQEHLPKLYTAGILNAPPKSPDDYEIKKPEKIPQGLGWNDEYAGELKTILHKHGVPREVVPELLALHEKTMVGTVAGLNTSFEKGMADLRVEHGDKFEERQELAKRFVGYILKTPEELALFEGTGVANHPAFLSVLMRLAPLIQQDSSFVAELNAAGNNSGGGSGKTHDDIRAELAAVMSDPKHPHNAGWKRNAPETLKYVDDLYKSVYGDKKVEIG